MIEPPLTPEEARVLGALIEKEQATPDYYPLTLNALVNACNQKSNREPVVAYTERDALAAIDRLRDRQYAFRVNLADSRVEKFEQNLDKNLGLTLQETAALCVLMLRGPQTIGEIRARAARLYPFEDMAEARAALDSMADRELVARMPPPPGGKEARYAHLLCGPPEMPAAPAPGEPQDTPAAGPGWRELHDEVAALRQEIDTLKRDFAEFKAQFE